MATLWDIVSGNSSLPVQAGNTFWDHINNQTGGGGTVIVSGVRTTNRLTLSRTANKNMNIRVANRLQSERKINRSNERTINLDLSYEANRCQ